MAESSTQARTKTRDIFAVERRERIRRLVNEHGRVRTSELAQLLDVTEPTIRKDILDLEAQKLLVRAHGGAVARGPMAEVDVHDRETKFIAEKRAIARACYDLIRPGDSVFLDGGTTQHELARILAVEEPLRYRDGQLPIKILTNSFRVAEICSGALPEAPLVLGGRYRPSGGCFVGPVAISTLQQFRVDIAFIGVTGVTETGFCAADVGEAQIKSEAISRAERVVIPMDHSKVGLSDFITICPVPAVHTVVTDRHDDLLAKWLGNGEVELVISTTGRRSSSTA
jgi:DeoR/GlpR family transcriptional regulator of sugar metabolism